MKLIFVCSLLLAVLLPSTLQQCLTPNDKLPPNPFGQQGLYYGQQEFSLALLQAINQIDPQANIFFSPYSTYHALLLAYFISSGKTEAFLKKALYLDPSQSKADIFNAYKLDKFATDFRAINSSYELTNANRIYVADQVSLRECVITIFGNEIKKKNFLQDPEAARNDINQWVENHTHEMIKELLQPGDISSDTNLVLVNAAYFKGKWENKFNPNLTKPEVFYISSSKTTVVDMMHVEGTFNYDISETLKAHILELPYEGKDISMYIFLPPFTQEGNIETVLKRLTPEAFKAVVNGSLLPRQVDLALPKFGLEHTIELVPVLNKIGTGNLFTPEADFSVLTNSSKLLLGNAQHKAKIEVTEEGTKAAASTVLFTFRSSRPLEPAQFVCNHPFVYVIFDKPEQNIIFSGVFRRPY